jgi:hypothetical protein
MVRFVEDGETRWSTDEATTWSTDKVTGCAPFVLRFAVGTCSSLTNSYWAGRFLNGKELFIQEIQAMKRSSDKTRVNDKAEKRVIDSQSPWTCGCLAEQFYTPDQ